MFEIGIASVEERFTIEGWKIRSHCYAVPLLAIEKLSLSELP